jgi:REP-associated tyrosine transposase
MPRRPRYFLPDGLYHVTGNGIHANALFVDDDDRRVFLHFLRASLREFGLECLAYCLLGTHYHLMLRGPREDLSVAMHRLNGRYANHINQRHSRVGHVFRDRYSAYVIRDEQHYENACAYIEANPVNAGLCPTTDAWPWTWVARGTGAAAVVPIPT